MCITIATMIIGAAISAGTSLMGAQASSQAAQSEAKWKNYQIEVENQQLTEQKEMTALKAGQAMDDRMEETRRLKAVNEASVAASGFNNESYLQGAEPFNERKMRQDLSTLRLNMLDQTNRLSEQIGVNKAEGQFAKSKADMTSNAAWIRGIGGAAADVIGAYDKYSFYNHPSTGAG